MKEFYTSVCRLGNNILYSGYDENGRRVKRRIKYKPTMYISTSDTLSPWSDIRGNPVIPQKQESMKDCKAFIDQYEGVSGIKVYGNTNYVAQYIHEQFPNEIDWKMPKILYWDIETLPTESGYSPAHEANGAISAITFIDNEGNAQTFSYKDYDHKSETLAKAGINVTKNVYDSESVMLINVVSYLVQYDASIYTGWNSVAYDMVYFVTRIIKLLGEDTAKRLSPWGTVHLREREVQGQTQYSYIIYGVEQLDYMLLFKKFGIKFGPQESYKLDAIAKLVLGKQKLDYSKYKNLKEMYEKDIQMYMEYNIIDTLLILELEKELGYINMCLTAAYSAKINYSEELATIPAWDSIIYGELLKRNICVPMYSSSGKRPYPGGYQKDLIKGYHMYVVTEDVSALYPSVIIQFNISPETIVGHVEGVCESIQPDVYVLSNKTDYGLPDNLCVGAAGYTFNTDKQGIIPELLQRFIDSRKVFKKEMKKIEAQMEKLKESSKEDTEEFQILSTRFNKYDALQNNAKLRANSLYGALGSAQFRWYDPRLAESITISGQIIIKASETAVNEYLQSLMNDKKDRVVYMHTDSAQICLEDIVEKYFKGKSEKEIVKLLVKIAQEKIEPLLDSEYIKLAKRFNCNENRISMKTEGVCTKTFYIAKAKYAQYVLYNEGVYYSEPHLKIVGLDAIRSNIPEIGREMMKESYVEIFERGEKALQVFIKNKKEWFKTLSIEEIAFPRGVNGLEKYHSSYEPGYIKGAPGHVKAALLYNKLISELKLGQTYDTINSGDKMKYVHLKKDKHKHPGYDRIGFSSTLPPEFKLDKVVDYDMQFKKAFLDPITNLLEVIGLEPEERNTMDSFFTME